jgi:hypothetical protein
MLFGVSSKTILDICSSSYAKVNHTAAASRKYLDEHHDRRASAATQAVVFVQEIISLVYISISSVFRNYINVAI